MDWFTSLDGVEELESAEAFLDFFGIPYEAVQVRSKRLHICLLIRS
jgi:nitrogenase-stabilizing/protective protein